MTRDELEELRGIYAEWGRGNFRSKFDFYDRDFEWGWSDEFPGLAGVSPDPQIRSDRLREFLSSWQQWHIEVEDFLRRGDYVVVLARYSGRGKGSGIEIASPGAHVWKLRAGKAVRLEIFSDRERALGSVPGADWDAATYDRYSDVQEAWAEETLARLPLRGDETVLDAGSGSGRVTARLVERLPRGRVIAVDSSDEMVARARALLGDRATVFRADLCELELDEPVDAVFSNAVFHWVGDQRRLYQRLFAALRPGGVLVAQCGAEGNLERFFATVREVSGQAPFRDHLARFSDSWRFPAADETERNLRAAGFASGRAWVTRSDVAARDAAGFLRAAPLRCHLELLPERLHDAFVDAVRRRCGEPLRLDYLRLNIEAKRAPAESPA